MNCLGSKLLAAAGNSTTALTAFGQRYAQSFRHERPNHDGDEHAMQGNPARECKRIADLWSSP